MVMTLIDEACDWALCVYWHMCMVVLWVATAVKMLSVLGTAEPEAHVLAAVCLVWVG